MLDHIKFFLFEDSKYFQALILLIFFGLYLRFLLQIFGQLWVKTKAHTITLILLPITTYVVTNVISGNIALSLGMVGALSIVRFRNPVRSPLELSAYFASITMGISASVSLNWLIFFIFAITLVFVLMHIVDSIYKKLFSQSLFITSFSEGNLLSTLTVISKNEIQELEKNDNLISITKSNELFTYCIASNNFSVLKNLRNNNDIIKNAIEIDLRRQ
jgi:hypothetical protein